MDASGAVYPTDNTWRGVLLCLGAFVYIQIAGGYILFIGLERLMYGRTPCDIVTKGVGPDLTHWEITTSPPHLAIIDTDIHYRHCVYLYSELVFLV